MASFKLKVQKLQHDELDARVATFPSKDVVLEI